MSSQTISVDAVIFGGGVAGLWLLDELRRRGYDALLCEAYALGGGQTIASQGIIHGGLKYMFDGRLTPSASTIREMPGLWRECFAGKREPNLSGTIIRAEGCHIWGTGSIMSRLFLKGSTLALRTAPRPVEKAEWPEALAKARGKVLRVGEQVIDPASMAKVFAERNKGMMLHIDPERVAMEKRAGRIEAVRVVGRDGNEVEVRPGTVILTAGDGNEALRRMAGLSDGAMQRRPLHMAMVRGRLPELWGHCVAGPRPRVTITSAVDSGGRVVWQVGGQIAEDGVRMDGAEMIEHAREELEACVPGIDLSEAEFAEYRIDRAEAATAAGQRPDDVQIVSEGNVLTVWPTKLALAPRMVGRVMEMMPAASGGAETAGRDFPVPSMALPPWEIEQQWVRGVELKR